MGTVRVNAALAANWTQRQDTGDVSLLALLVFKQEKLHVLCIHTYL